MPAQIADLSLWYDADDAASIVFGTGSKVATWKDRSPSVFDVQANISQQPDRVADTLVVGRYGIQFASGKWLAGTGPSANQKPLTAFAVIKHTGLAADRAILSTNSNGGFHWELDPANKQLVNQQYVANIAWSTSAVPVNTTLVICVTYSATGEMRYYLNNVADGVTTNDKPFNAPTPNTYVGAGIAQGFHDGTIGEIVKYNRVLTAPERDQVYNYLYNRWGPPIVLAVQDCFHSHVSQQPAAHYLDPSIGGSNTVTTPDPGVMPSEWVMVMKILGPRISAPGSWRAIAVQEKEAAPVTYSWHMTRYGPEYSGTDKSRLTGIFSTTGAWAESSVNVVGSEHVTFNEEWFAFALRSDPHTFWCYRSTDHGATWTLIQTAGKTPTPFPLFDSPGPVRIGAPTSDSSDVNTFPGRIYFVECRTGIDPLAGSVFWRFDAADHVSGTSWTDPRGHTWTAESAASLVHVPAAADITIIDVPPIALVVQDCQHTFVDQTDMGAWLVPSISRATTPDPLTLPTDGFVFVAKIRGPLSTSTTFQTLVSQDRNDPNRSFRLNRRPSDGFMRLEGWPTGLAAGGLNYLTAAVTGGKTGLTEYIAVSRITSTQTWDIMRSTNGGISYEAYAPTVSGSTSGFLDSSDVMTIGADGLGTSTIWDDQIYWIELRTGVDPVGGTLLWRFDANDHVSGTAWTDLRGHTWTLTTAAAITRPTTDRPTIEVQVAPTLANADSYHTVTSDTPTLTQQHVLAVDNAAHAITSDSPPLTQVHVLTVANAAHTEASDSPGLTQVHVLTVAGAAHAQAVDHVSINTATNVPAADAAHAIVSDSPALTQLHVLVVDNAAHTLVSDNVTTNYVVLAPANAAHAHAVDAPSITQVHVLTVQSAAHAHAANAPSITQLHILAAVQSAAHAHVADNVAITQLHLLIAQGAAHTIFSPEVSTSTEGVVAGADTYHPLISDTVTLTQVHNLIVQNALHVHLADNATLVYNVNLTVASAAHAHSADVPTLVYNIFLTVASAAHAHAVENVVLNYVVFVVANAAHAQTVTSPFIIVDIPVLNAAHAHTASNIAITQDHFLAAVADTAHAHSVSGDLLLTQIHKLTVDSTGHLHVADEVAFTQDHFLVAADTQHAHDADEDLALTQVHNLAVASALHAHSADVVGPIEVTVWLEVWSAWHAHRGEEVNLAGIIKLTDAVALYLGAQVVRAAYVGATKVWP